MQTFPGKIKLPSSLFAPLPSHEIAQEIADKNYLPDEADELIEKIVKSALRSRPSHSGAAKKRKIEGAGGGDATAAKKKKVQKDKALPIRKPSKTPKKRTMSEDVPSSERRRSGRAAPGVSYKEEDSDEDDEMEPWDEPVEESEDAQAGKEDSSEVDDEPEEEEAEPEPEPVRTNGTKAKGKTPTKSKVKAAVSSPASAKSKGKASAPTPAPATRGRRTRAAAAAGDEMED